MVTCVSGREDLGTGGLRPASGDGRSRSLVRKSRVATSSWPCWRMPSSMKAYCADLASWVASRAMTTISSARSVSVIVVAFGDRSICWTRPSMNVVTVTVPGGFVTVNSGTGSSSLGVLGAARAHPSVGASASPIDGIVAERVESDSLESTSGAEKSSAARSS